MIKTCQACFKTFSTDDSKHKYCGWSCYRSTRKKRVLVYVCELCSKEFEPINKSRRFCGQQCMGIVAQMRRVGRIVTRDGYVKIYVRPLGSASTGKYVFEHRMIMERHLGRSLADDEVVHHKNRDTQDNRLENLEVMSRSAHISGHNVGKRRPFHKLPADTQRRILSALVKANAKRAKNGTLGGAIQRGKQKQKHTRPKSGFKGVKFVKQSKRYLARLMKGRKEIQLGSFFTAVEAAKAYDNGARQIFGANAFLNFPKLGEQPAFPPALVAL